MVRPHLPRAALGYMMKPIMAGARNEFTRISRLEAESFGEPGQRTFRIYVECDGGDASIWIEKEHLLQLALAIQQMAASAERDARTPSPPPEYAGRGYASMDIRVAKLALGHDPRLAMFVIDVHDIEDVDSDATLRVWADMRQLERFSEEAFRVCAAGRPLCPLCGRAIDADGHMCPRVNGHAPIAPDDLADLDLAEEE